MAAVILAAGRSRRMPGSSKLMRDFRGESVIRTVARTAERCGLDPIVVVTGPEDSLDAHLRDLPVETTSPGPELGDRLTSLLCGLRAPRTTDTRAVVVLLGDEPEVDETDVASVKQRWLAGGVELVRARYTDRPGHPVVLSADLARRLLADPPAGGDPDRVWERLRERCAGWAEAMVSRPAPIDVDTPADLETARARRRAT